MQASDIDWSKAPEGATHWEPDSDAFEPSFMRKRNGVWECFWLDEWMDARIDDEGRVERFIPRPAAWDGTGLPPAGCEIEYHSPSRGWQPGEYIGQFNGQMVIGCRETGVIGYCPAEIVRPIRTPEQIAADERERAVDAMMETFVVTGCKKSILRGACLALYDAGYRKVEGDKQ